MTWLTTEEAAIYVRRSPDEIRRMAAAGTIPSHRFTNGAHYRFDKAELDAWCRGGLSAAKPVRPLTTRPRKG